MPFPLEQLLSRFVFNSDHVRLDRTLHHRLFKPRRGDALSLYDVDDLNRDRVCAHGHRYADDPVKGRIHCGYGELRYEAIKVHGLETKYDNSPPRHVSVFLPEEDERRLELAKAIAAKSKFRGCN